MGFWEGPGAVIPGEWGPMGLGGSYGAGVLLGLLWGWVCYGAGGLLWAWGSYGAGGLLWGSYGAGAPVGLGLLWG